MRKKFFVGVAFFFIVQLFTVGAAFAEYDSSGDITVSVNVLEDQVETSDSTGEFTFETQEGAHDSLTDTSGQEVDHSYIWLEVNGSRVLAVDPPKPCF
jgi:hypothetical protein